MSREDLKNFFHSVEHSTTLRSKLRNCKGNEPFFKLAKEYGFIITIEDLKQDEIAEKVNNWFKTSQLSKLRKSNQ